MQSHPDQRHFGWHVSAPWLTELEAAASIPLASCGTSCEELRVLPLAGVAANLAKGCLLCRPTILSLLIMALFILLWCAGMLYSGLHWRMREFLGNGSGAARLPILALPTQSRRSNGLLYQRGAFWKKAI